MPARSAAVCLLFVLTPCVIIAQQGAITGLVLDADNGDLLAKVQLTLVPSDLRNSRPVARQSDSFGRFQFQGLAAGEYSILAARTGYVEQTSRELNRVRVTGEGAQGVAIQMRRGAVVTGRVTDEFGEPVAGAAVMAMPSGQETGLSQQTAGLRATTDDRGEYRLFGLPPGEYVITARVTASRALVPQPAYEPAFFPVAEDGSLGQPFPLGPGEERRGADMRLRVRSAER